MGCKRHWVTNKDTRGPFGTVSCVTLGMSLDLNEFYDYAVTCGFSIYIKNKFNKNRNTVQPPGSRSPHLLQVESLQRREEGRWVCASGDPVCPDVMAKC